MGGNHTTERNISVGQVRQEDNRIKFTTEIVKNGFHFSVNLRIYYVTQVFSTIFLCHHRLSYGNMFHRPPVEQLFKTVSILHGKHLVVVLELIYVDFLSVD